MSSVPFVRLGNSGLKVSKIVLGCMTYGDKNWQPWLLNEEQGKPLIKHAYDRGLQTFDVADAYSNGVSEEILGRAIREYGMNRDRIVVMSKIFHHVDPAHGPLNAAEFGVNDGPRVNQCGLSRKHILAAVDASVERLGTYIDVLQIHRLDHDTPMEEIMKALNDCVESGKVRYLGASSMRAWEFQMMQNIAEKNGWHKFISMQGLHNLISREEEREMIPYCQATGVGYMPWSPLAAGVLAHGWSDRSDDRENSDVFLKALFRSKEDESDKATVGRVEELANKRGVGMAQIAIAWSVQKGGGLVPILGLDSIDRIDQAVEALKIDLTAEEVEFLEGCYMPKMPFV